jgi:uncharacterized Tic20 family protein
MSDAKEPITPAPAPSGPAQPPGAPAAPSKDEKTMAMLCHLVGGLVGFLVPLIIWLIKKDTMPFVDDQGKEALNFQITLLIGYVAIGILSVVTCGVGGFLLPLLWVLSAVFGIMGGLKANEGVAYRYPFAVRLIK